LFVADVGEFAGGTARLDGWQLQVTPMAPVPEPGEIALVSALGLGALAMWRRRGLVR
jgi:MYXO-CTERM domain-containing protein